MPAQEIELADDIDEYQYFLEKEWSDGFPVVAPNAKRLAWLLAGTPRDPDEVIGDIPPAGVTATVRDVALHARQVLAGVRAQREAAVAAADAVEQREVQLCRLREVGRKGGARGGGGEGEREGKGGGAGRRHS